jgi:hypothetical protein
VARFSDNGPMASDGGPGVAPPVVLLDVDGVLNAIAASPDQTTWSDWVRASASADGVQWPLLFSPSVLRAVTRWTEVADVRWLSTWGDHANHELRRAFGLPSLSVFASPPDRNASWTPSMPAGSRTASTGEAHADLSRTTWAHPPKTERHDSEHMAPQEWWKLTAVRHGLTSGDLADRALLWIDDDLATHPQAKRLVENGVNRLALAPPRRIGLTPRLLREANAFLTKHSHSP